MDGADSEAGAVTRRGLLVTGGVGLGLVVAYAVWPRHYAPNLAAAPGETVLSAWVKVGEDGRVTVAVPQAEGGQGVWTALPQIVAEELGADWRQVGVEPASLSPLYANPLAVDELWEGLFDPIPAALRATWAERSALMLTAASTSVRMFEAPCRAAGAGARVLLAKAAARRWRVGWRECKVDGGFVRHGTEALRFGELAAAAAGETLPDPVPLRSAPPSVGKSLPRLDAPAKVDGSATFAADVRLPDMVFASVRAGPIGDPRLVRTDKAAANRVGGVLEVVETDRWVAAVATNWWAANRALDALAPRFQTRGGLVSSSTIDAALDAAFAAPGERMVAVGDVGAAFRNAHLIAAEYRVGLGVHAAIETPCATAQWRHDRLELWLPTQAPGLARAAAARAIGVAESAVTIHPTLIGGGFGEALESDVAEQAAVLAHKLRRPVQLTWSRAEALIHDRFRPPAAIRLAARLGASGTVDAWLAQIAAPSTGRELAARLMPGDALVRAVLAHGVGDPYAVAGATPPYRIPALAIDHHPAAIGLPTGYLRGGAHGTTAFATECFVDELAHVAGTEAMSFRIAMLGGEPRLARCLSTATALGGWNGGVPGSGQGIACHAFRGSYVAVLAEAHVEGGRVHVDRLVAAVDCGRVINPALVRQQIEGGLIFGMAQATGASTGVTENLPDARGFGALGLPRLRDTPDVTVELIPSDAAPGGVSELAVPPVAPAIANALQAATGYRLRRLPLVPGEA